MLSALPLVHSTRGPIVECIHRGHLVVMNSKQERILSIGVPNFLTFARSAAKFIQVLPLIMSGVVEKFRLKIDILPFSVPRTLQKKLKLKQSEMF